MAILPMIIKRQQELSQLTNLEPELALLIASERKRIQELTKEGVRKVSFLRLYVTFTVADGEDKSADWMKNYSILLRRIG